VLQNSFKSILQLCSTATLRRHSSFRPPAALQGRNVKGEKWAEKEDVERRKIVGDFASFVVDIDTIRMGSSAGIWHDFYVLNCSDCNGQQHMWTCCWLCIALKHDAIQSFPSEQFYNSQLRIGHSQQARPSTLPFWPRGGNKPVMFINVIGVEKSLTVTTADGSEQSKSNDKEASLAVSWLS